MTHFDLDALFTRIDALVAEQMAADNSPGVALAVTDRERVLRIGTYGFADIAALVEQKKRA